MIIVLLPLLFSIKVIYDYVNVRLRFKANFDENVGIKAIGMNERLIFDENVGIKPTGIT